MLDQDVDYSPVKCPSRIVIGWGTRGAAVNMLTGATIMAHRPRRRFSPRHYSGAPV